MKPYLMIVARGIFFPIIGSIIILPILCFFPNMNQYFFYCLMALYFVIINLPAPKFLRGDNNER